MMIESTIDVQASAAHVMRCYRDVAGWSRWDPDTRAASLDGPMVVGATGRLQPTKGFAVPMRVVALTPLGFTVESSVPFGTLRFEHELLPLAQGTRITHRVAFGGPLAALYARLLAPRVRAGLPLTLTRLKQHLEQPTASGAHQTG